MVPAIGGIGALNYASRLNGFVEAIIVTSTVSVMYPMITKMATDVDIMGLKKTVIESITFINLLVVPATFGVMVFSEEIIRLLFGRGAFGLEALELTGSALFYYSLGMVTLGRRVLYRAFYAMQDTKTPMVISSISVGINIVFNVVLSKIMGLGGLALATSICSVSSAYRPK